MKSKQIKLYKISIYEEASGYCYVKAENDKQAISLAEYALNNEGVEACPGWDVQHRDVGILGCEELEGGDQV